MRRYVPKTIKENTWRFLGLLSRLGLTPGWVGPAWVDKDPLSWSKWNVRYWNVTKVNRLLHREVEKYVNWEEVKTRGDVEEMLEANMKRGENKSNENVPLDDEVQL